ncbi:PAS domain-containing protein [Agrobacterium tumefaciens]|uniref:PAS domain-containing protein n=1 Tax=Agrobacterium tumefaciens TaxID=358 RepID=UPI003BA3D1A8
MEATPDKYKRRVAAMIASGGGVLLSAAFLEPSGLLIAVAATSMCIGWRTGLLAVFITSAMFWTMLHMMPLLGDSHEAPSEAIRLGAFLLSAIGLWFVVLGFRQVSFFDQVHRVSTPDDEDIPGLGWSAYPDGRMRFVNPAALKFIGVTVDEMKRIREHEPDAWWRLFIHPDDVENSKRIWNHSLKTGEPLLDEQRVRRHDGIYRWFRDSAVASRDERGNITGWYGTTVDIDDQRKAEEAVRESEQKLQQMIDTVPALIWCADADGVPSYVNKTMLDWCGWSLEMFIDPRAGSPASLISDHVHPHDVGGMMTSLQASFSTGEPFFFKYRQRNADGAYRWIESKAHPLRDGSGKILQWYAVCHDVTESVEAHAAVEASERELRVLIDTVPALIWLLTPEGQPQYFNKRFVDWCGISLGQDIVGDGGRLIDPAELIHPADRRDADLAFRRAIARGEAIHHKGRLMRKDGSYWWVDSRVEPLRDGNGKITRWYGVSFVIEEEVRAQTALEESQRSLQHLIDSVPVGILVSNRDGHPVFANRRYREASGEVYSTLQEGPAAINAPIDLVHLDDRDGVIAQLAHFHQEGAPFTMRFRQRRSDGVYRWVEGRSEPLRDENGEVTQWYSVNLDIEDEVRAQEALRHAAERLSRASRAASLAEFSVSIAHQLNQPLQSVVSNSDAFRRWLAMTPPNFDRATQTADAIVRDAELAAQIVGRIRALFNQSNVERQRVDINLVIRGVCDLVADRMVAAGIKLSLRLLEPSPLVNIDRLQIEQVVLNLIRNSIEAMQEIDAKGRRLVISSELAEPGVVDVKFKDNGIGIEDVSRIFDPFYTTKSDGMGMGLAICRTIIETHSGALRAENIAKGGAMVGFSLPVDFTSDNAALELAF